MTEVMKQKLVNMAGPTGMGRLFSGMRLAGLLAAIAALVTVAVVLGLWQGSSQYRPLYGEAEQFDRSQVIAVLEEKGLDYYVEPQKGSVMVDRNSLGKARLALAAAGVEAQLPAGLEILSQDSSLGTSQFVENARYRHGLEGELARSIMALDAVRNVRVHLAMPKQTLFVRRDKEQASASVILSLQPGQALSTEQVTAIVNLVAGSVPELEPDQVNVIDQQGNLLSALVGEGRHGKNSSAYLDYVQKLEATYINRASRMLRPMVGNENFQVEVAAAVNFDRTEATEELYSPEGTVRSEFSSYDRRVGKAAQGVPGALSNRPPEEGDEEKDPNAGNERGENSRDYAMDRTMKHTYYQQGQIERLSVSVLLNGDPASFPPAKIDSIRQMLGDAMGIEAARGDSFSLHVYPFNKAEAQLLAEEPVWWMQNVWLDYLRYILSAIVALVILLVVVRPAIRQLAGERQRSKDPILDNVLPESKTGSDVATLNTNNNNTVATSDSELEAPLEKAAMTEATLSSAVVSEGSMPELPSPETGLEIQTSYLQTLSEKEPERVAHVVKQWITPKDADE
ncbi:flagellar basal-body MS-ring/collar protein FliF [Photobacterium sanguinicancri]|uniref:flagellar basal-body MS-ring/collar protein FliF n=1 Tax=Photobacterium sanguinicancri TaxID=875932 RepID=UPI000787E63C|nr:flagellar basal-body MS-ring/collar protein FliF [Photobacterium sanguinicancri]KXI22962.1 flagellar MS-ring protein [Photobacterium sanguinicancri]